MWLRMMQYCCASVVFTAVTVWGVQALNAQPRMHESPAMQAVRRCPRGDWNCVIRGLEGRAHSDRELGLLAVAYRNAGQTANARRVMAEYLRRFPDGPFAAAFRQYTSSSSREARSLENVVKL